MSEATATATKPIEQMTAEELQALWDTRWAKLRRIGVALQVRHPGQCLRCGRAVLRHEEAVWLPPTIRQALGVRQCVMHLTDHSCACADPWTRGYDD